MADDDHVTLTYRELADRLGLSLDAAKSLGKRRARSGRWSRWTGNDGTARLRVPVDDLGQPGVDPGEQPQGSPQADPGQDPAGWEAYRSAVDREISRLDGIVDALREDVERERARAERIEGERDRERQARQTAEQQAREAERQRDEAQAEADRLRRRGIIGRLLGR